MLQDIQFRDSQVQKCFERNMAEVADRSAQMSQVGALMAVCDMFRLVEGPHSPRVHEAIEHLLAPGLRPILRNWYRHLGLHLSRQETAFRDELSALANERF
jgi:hypothetical protein